MPVLSLKELTEALTRIEERLDRLEAAIDDEAVRAGDAAKQEEIRADELSKLAWAAKHGRQRPW
jgi:hypothetical protein